MKPNDLQERIDRFILPNSGNLNEDLELKTEKLVKSLEELEEFSGGKVHAYSNEANARHFVHKILMDSLEGQGLVKQDEQEISFFDVRIRPDIQIKGKN